MGMVQRSFFGLLTISCFSAVAYQITESMTPASALTGACFCPTAVATTYIAYKIFTRFYPQLTVRASILTSYIFTHLILLKIGFPLDLYVSSTLMLMTFTACIILITVLSLFYGWLILQTDPRSICQKVAVFEKKFNRNLDAVRELIGIPRHHSERDLTPITSYSRAFLELLFIIGTTSLGLTAGYLSGSGKLCFTTAYFHGTIFLVDSVARVILARWNIVQFTLQSLLSIRSLVLSFVITKITASMLTPILGVSATISTSLVSLFSICGIITVTRFGGSAIRRWIYIQPVLPNTNVTQPLVIMNA